MRALFRTSVFLLVGFTAGWLAKSRFPTDIEPLYSDDSIISDSKIKPSEPFPYSYISFPENKEPHQPKRDNNESFSPTNNALNTAPSEGQNSGGSSADQFIFLLNQRNYSGAMDYYQEVFFRDSALANALKIRLVGFLEEKLDSMALEVFSNTAEAWLGEFYSDNEVLLLLAEYNSLQDFYGEAIGVYQLAYNYAKNSREKQKTSQAIFDFLTSKDGVLAGQGDWHTLQNLYELAEEAGISQRSHAFRLAEIYLHNDYRQKSKEIAEELIHDRRFAEKAKLLLKQIDENSTDFHPEEILGQSVSLEKYGAHYVTQIRVNGNTSLGLMLDTGASITAISRDAANKIHQAGGGVENLEPRLFNTANGVVKGQVFRVDEVEFGGFILRNIEMAVLPVESQGNRAGLLGMNILSQFKFHLDQEKAQLILQAKN